MSPGAAALIRDHAGVQALLISETRLAQGGPDGFVLGFAGYGERELIAAAEWLGLLLEYEMTLRRQKQFETRGRAARLRHPASVEDVNYQAPRGLMARAGQTAEVSARCCLTVMTRSRHHPRRRRDPRW